MIHWAFALDHLTCFAGNGVALILDPSAIARLPALSSDARADAARGGGRSVLRRQVLAALAERISSPAEAPFRLSADADGHRSLNATGMFASVAERAGWVAAVLAPEPIGIDIEEIAGARVSLDAVIDRVDAINWAAWSEPAGLWTAREAALKAMGRDLTSHSGRWRFGAATAVTNGIQFLVDTICLPTMVASVAYVGT